MVSTSGPAYQCAGLGGVGYSGTRESLRDIRSSNSTTITSSVSNSKTTDRNRLAISEGLELNTSLLSGSRTTSTSTKNTENLQGISTCTAINAVGGLDLVRSYVTGKGVVARGASQNIRTSSERTCLAKPETEAGQRFTGGLVGRFGTAPPLSHRGWGKTTTQSGHRGMKANGIRLVGCPTHFPPSHRNYPVGWANPAR